MEEKTIEISRRVYNAGRGKITVIQSVPDISDEERSQRAAAAAHEVLWGVYYRPKMAGGKQG